MPIPYWKGQRDYYSSNDPKYSKHISDIEIQERINTQIDASAGDSSYSIILNGRI